MERAQAAQGPSFSVRRDAQKLAASRRSNNLCARFFTARGAMKKSPHEPRSQILRALPWPPDSAQRRIKMPVTKAIRNHALLCAFFLLNFIDKLEDYIFMVLNGCKGVR